MTSTRKFFPRVRSRHPSHNGIRRNLEKMPFRSVVRLGSTTVEESVGGKEVNSVEAVKTSSNKLLMKRKFKEELVNTAIWAELSTYTNVTDEGITFSTDATGVDFIKFPVVVKHIYGSRGTGNFLLKSEEEFNNWKQGKELSKYIIEKFYNYSREYRLHVTEEGCFYTCRKMLKSDTPEGNRWFRNDSNSVWILEENDKFDKPINWDEVVDHSVRALKSVGLDIGAIDVKIQSSKNRNGELRDSCDFIILETNSAPSFGEITLIKYKEEIPKILKKKYL